MFWTSNTTSGSGSKKQSIAVDYEPDFDRDGRVSDLQEFPFCITMVKGNGQLWIFLSVPEMEALVQQGNFLFQEVDRARVEKGLGGV